MTYPLVALLIILALGLAVAWSDPALGAAVEAAIQGARP